MKAAPRNAADAVTSSIKTSLQNTQANAKAELDAARREIGQRKP